MTNNPVQEAGRLGQAVWLDYIRRGMLTSGELQQFIDRGITGVTSNPTIFEKAIAGSTDYDDALATLARSKKSTLAIYEALAVEDIRQAADQLRPVYDRSDGVHGYVSLEVSPGLAHDTDGTVNEARRLFATLDRPNVMIKVPGTPAGIPAFRHLIGAGININVTLLFSLDSYALVREAYVAGLEDLVTSGGNPTRVASVASFFLSRVDTAVDRQLEELIGQGRGDLRDLLGKAANASARQAYQAFGETFHGERFAALRARGARVQRPLWASTGTKNAAYSDVLYVEPLIGPDTVNTMPPDTIAAFLDHGRAEVTINAGLEEAQHTLATLEAAGISMDCVTQKLLVDGVKAFQDSFDKLLAGIKEKKARLQTRDHTHSGVTLGTHLPDVEVALADLEHRRVTRRIWRKDHTVWKRDPTEIVDRLGWLSVTSLMREQVSDMASFAREVCDAGFQDVVLLGMGGSSLGPEVLRQTFGSSPGYPRLTVLDSVIPASVQSVAEAIDPARTMFLVSSKSGTTAEPSLLYQYFRAVVETAVGKEQAGGHFVAVTDPGTPLADLAAEHGFRRTFFNPPDIGGRYSVLSYFGLVPASLLGINVERLLDGAEGMRDRCASRVPPHLNPGAWLGAAMGAMAVRGYDKLTIMTSPAINSFGLWVEQLIAESTGKEGKGIIPIVGEPLLSPDTYADDRLFVYLRLEGDDNGAIDTAVKGLEGSEQPSLVVPLADKYALGAEFFRWEFATAVAGAVIGINAFDQPDVQAAKDATLRVLREYQASGHLPQADAVKSLADLMSRSSADSYLAIMAYIRQTPEVDETLSELRRNLGEHYGIPTTVGYGPRFLHSTGQLHKGGPDTGLFLQITAGHKDDMPIPGEAYTFGVVADAQALGDLQALQSLGRQVARVHLEHADGQGIAQLANMMSLQR